MATQLYLRELVPALWGTSTGSVAHWVAGDAGFTVTLGADTLNTLDPRYASTTVGTGTGIGRNINTVAGTTAGKVWAFAGQFSAPLAADITISGTVNFDICALESSMNANATVRVAVLRVDKNGALTLIADSSFGTELTTSNARKSWSTTPTSTAMEKGDRLLIMPMIDDATALTMASGFTVTIQYDGSNANTADSSVTFTENLTFITSAPSGSKYYLRATASDISSAKALSTTQGSGTVTATHTTVAGPHTFPGDLWTATAGGSDIEWFSPRLDAFTLGGAVTLEIGATDKLDHQSQASPFDRLVMEIAICNADGSGATVWASCYAFDHWTGASISSHWISGPDTAVTAGQRLRFRLYQNDWHPDNAVAGTDRTMRYDGTSTYASALTFTQTLTEFTPADLRPPPVFSHQAVQRAASW